MAVVIADVSPLFHQRSLKLHQSMVLSPIELAYQNQIDQMSPAERVARTAAMFQWTREQLARQIISEQAAGKKQAVGEGGKMSDEELKWKVALRLYGNEPEVRKMIEQKLADVSR